VEYRRIMSRLAVAGIALLLCLLCLIVYGHTTYALGSLNLEMEFLVADAETGEPIPKASIVLMAEDYKKKGLEQPVINLFTDDRGRARVVHENVSCEDVIRPFRKTITLIDLTWASVNVSAKKYSPIEKMWLHTAKYANNGYFSKGRFRRIEFTVPLH
jgi:hypothetical protein